MTDMHVMEQLTETVVLHCGDCLDVLKTLESNSIDACVTDPPYGLEFMGKDWDKFAPNDRKNASVWNGRRQGQEHWKEDAAERSGKGGGGPSYKSQHKGARRCSSCGKRQFSGSPCTCAAPEWIIEHRQEAPSAMVGFQAFSEAWAREVYRVLKPGAHLLAFGGTRTYHRMACAIEDAGFEVRDCVQWIYGQGFPKSHDVSKGIDRVAGAERTEVIGIARTGISARSREGDLVGGIAIEASKHIETFAPATPAASQWSGFGTALKPACELIVLARKPLSEGTVAANVLRWGTGALNIDGCRIAGASRHPGNYADKGFGNIFDGPARDRRDFDNQSGRWPANVIHDGSDEVVGAFPETSSGSRNGEYANGTFSSGVVSKELIGDSGSAARFFYQVKKDDDQCHSTKSASDVECAFDLRSDHAASALSLAVEASTPRLVLDKQSYRGRDMSVSELELKIACESVIEVIQNSERRSALGLPQENYSGRLGPVMYVAQSKPTGIMTITLSLLRSDRSVGDVTFDIIEMSAEAGAKDLANSRLFYTAKADADDRLGSRHPTVKPLDLIQYLVRLVTPPGGLVLDPFAGTGTTGEAAWREGIRAVLIEREAEYQDDIRRRMRLAIAMASLRERSHESVKAKQKGKPRDDGPLFATARESWDEMWERPFDYSKLRATE